MPGYDCFKGSCTLQAQSSILTVLRQPYQGRLALLSAEQDVAYTFSDLFSSERGCDNESCAGETLV